MMTHRRCLPAVLVAALLLGGCAGFVGTGPPPNFALESAPEPFHPIYEKLAREGERNWVLNLNILAMAALRAGDRDTAKRALDESIRQIEVIYGDSPQARRARSLFYSEGSKIFKGDPYERSMTYFYRGILYMHDGEWDNARACFRSALLHDSFAEDEQSVADWTLFHYLVGVCETQMRNTSAARDAFRRAETEFARFPERYGGLVDPASRWHSGGRKSPLRIEGPLQYPADANLLVITQLGSAPQKVARGTYGQQLDVVPGGGGDSRVRLFVDGQEQAPPTLTDSVYFQAATRGGRPLDSILQAQANVKKATATTGGVGALAGTAILLDGLDDGNSDQAWLGAGLVAAGGALMAAAELARPEADTRTWRSLPDALGVWAASLDQQEAQLAIEVTEPSGRRWVTPVERLELPRPGEGLTVVLSFPPPEPYLLVPMPRRSTGDPVGPPPGNQGSVAASQKTREE